MNTIAMNQTTVYRVRTFTDAGLSAKMRGSTILCYHSEDNRWVEVDNAMWETMKTLGIRQGWASATEAMKMAA